MLFLAHYLVQINAAVIKFLLLDPLAEVLYLKDLGIHVADCGHKVGIDLGDHADLPLVLRIIVLCSVFERCIDVDLLAEHAGI